MRFAVVKSLARLGHAIVRTVEHRRAGTYLQWESAWQHGACALSVFGGGKT